MKRNKPTYIYALRCPKTNVVKYVGKTIDPSSRLRKHLTERRNTLKCKWIIGLSNNNLFPIFDIIETVEPYADWEAREIFHIKYYKDKGEAFCNQTLGGESGSNYGVKQTNAHKQNISASNKGMPNPAAILSNKINKGFKVIQFDLNGNVIAIHHSTHEAAKAIKRDQRRIQAMCKHGRINGKVINSVGGFKFQYQHEANL